MEEAMIDIVKKLDKETEKHIRQSPRNSNRSSELGWWEECPRYLVLVRTDPDKLPLHDINLQRIFDEGTKQERLVRAELEEANIEVHNVQRDEKWTHLNISGHIDGTIPIDGKNPILEIKSCSPNVFRAIQGFKTAEDLKNSKYFWIRGYYAQMQGYHLLFNEEEGVILFKDKSTGQKHQIESHIDYGYCEEMCKVIEEVNDRVERNDPWPAKECEACNRCGFAQTLCFPGKDYGEGYEFYSDDELEIKLNRREEIKAIAKEYDQLDDEIKKCFKGKNAVVGDFLITSDEYERKSYKVPNEIKEQYLEITTYFRTKIEKLGGKLNGITE
jgi:hypothetical protein